MSSDEDDTGTALDLWLFYLGSSASGKTTVATVEELVESQGPGSTLTLIDLQEKPELASEYNILAIPTLIRMAPEPRVRVVGELNDAGAILSIVNG